MSTLSVKASFDGSELVQGFSNVKTELAGLKSAGEKAGKSLGEMLQQKNSTTNYTRQLSQIKAELTDLSVNYARLSDADKNTEFGQAMAARIDELKIKAQELKTVFDDVSDSLKPGADFGEQWSQLQRSTEQTRAKFESVQKISSGVASGFAALQGVTALLGTENENLQKALLKVQSAMAIAQGVSGIKDLYEGLMQASLAFGVGTSAATANTVATTANTVAKTENTVSMNANSSAATKNATALTANTAANAANSASLVNTTAKGGILTACVTKLKAAFSGLTKFLAGAGGPIAAFAAVAVGAIAVVGNMDKIQRAIKGFSEAEQAAIDAAKLNTELVKLASQSSAEKIVRVRELATIYSNLGDNLSAKQKFVSDFAGELDNMGIQMSDVNDAEYIFVEATDDYINAIMARAKADAIREKATKDYQAALEEQARLEEEVAKQKALRSAGTPEKSFWENVGQAIISASVFEGAPVDVTQDFNDDWTKEIADKKVAAAEKALQDHITAADAKMKKAFEDAAAQDAIADGLLKPRGSGGGNGGSGGGNNGGKTNTEIKKTLASVNADYTNTTAEIEDKYKNNVISFEQYLVEMKQAAEKYISDIVDLEGPITEAQAEQIVLAGNLSKTYDASLKTLQQIKAQEEAKAKSLEDYNTELSRIQTLEEEGILDGKDARELQISAAKRYYDFLISNWSNLTDAEKANARAIKASIDAYNSIPRGRTVEYRNEQQKKVSEIQAQYESGIITKDAAQNAIDAINADLAQLKLNPIEITLDTNQAISQLDAFSNSANAILSSIQSLGSYVSSIDSVYQSFKNMGDQMNEAENGWERFMVGFNAGMQILNVFSSTLGMVNTLMTTFNTIQEITTALKLKDTAASAAQATADSTAAGATMTKAGANMAEAATGAGKAVSWLPIVGPILAIAAIGALMGVLLGVMSKSKYATGGIVPGNRIGDMDLVRVNGGEMILNGRQQKNLFNMLDQNRLPIASGQKSDVNFRIQGDALVGVIENYNKKRSRR